MAITHPTRLLTAEDLEAMGSEIKLLELYDGVLRETERMGGRHGEFQLEISSPLHAHVRAHQLGRVYPSDTHFILFRDPDTVVAPDVGFISEVMMPGGPRPKEFIPHPPDLAVEVMSGSDRFIELERKARRYLDAGTQLVWVLRPDDRAAVVFAPGSAPRELTIDDELDGGEVLPGFRLPLTEVFP